MNGGNAAPDRFVPAARAAGTIVLIHGAWAGGWVWTKIIPLLVEQGFDPIAVDLPGSDGGDFAAAMLDGYCDHVCTVLSGLEHPAWLVSHSGGGATAAAVAEAMPDRVLGIVFIAGMMLPSGVSFGELFALSPEPLGDDVIVSHLVPNAAGTATRVPVDVARAVFFQLADPDEALAAAMRLGWQSDAGKDLRPILTADRHGKVPRLYVEATKDRSVVIAAQRYMQQLSPGAIVVTLEADHAPMLSMPTALVSLLLPFLGGHRTA